MINIIEAESFSSYMIFKIKMVEMLFGRSQ